ncbi:MAG TPA: adenylate/guanylate cyclase domain-containing protein [Microthrixaceae bacterium]|nr:adenylate/guanylate cyclase domain-containing protein [Microthrixaceae bacterium]
MASPTTRYAQSGELSIAYQCVGEGPIDILVIPGFVSNVELLWDLPAYAAIRDRLGAFGRITVFDKRGTGCSDRSLGTGSAEDRMDDVRAVADAAGIDRAVVIGISEGGPLATLFATTYPERVQSLVLWGTFARCLLAPDYEIGRDPELVDWFIGQVREQWGTGHALGFFLGEVDDEEGVEFMARYERQTASPGVVATILRHNADIDVRHALGAIRVPTLVVHRVGDPLVPVDQGRYLAQHIAGARMAEVPGDFHLGDRTGDQEPVLDAITEFITGAPVSRPVDVDRVLMTVLFTDIVDSTAHAATLGDKAWKALLERHDDAAAAAVERHRGVVVKRTGDGLLATFDGPGRAVRAACGLREAVRSLGIDVRAGLHTGEVERRTDDVAGIGVHIGARVSGLAGPGEVLVTSTVKDLVFGSELEFEDRGTRTLKGVPGDWHLWAAV